MAIKILKTSFNFTISTILFIILSVVIQLPVISWLNADMISLDGFSPFYESMARVILFLLTFIFSFYIIYVYSKYMGIDLKRKSYALNKASKLFMIKCVAGTVF